MRTLIRCLPVLVSVSLNIPDAVIGASKANRNSDLLRVYEVNKKVSDFPEKEDFSTPEAAYAVINRVMASGEQGAWRRISAKSNQRRLPQAKAKKVEVKPEAYKMWLNASIVEVRIFRDTHAVVIAKITSVSGATEYDKRSLELENGRWLNKGQSIFRTLDDARSGFARSCARYADKPVRPKIEDPESYLRPFVEFLETRGEEPKPFVMKALARHRVVIMGEIHHRPRYWSFNASLVRDPDFPRNVGVIYMELPANDQGLIDKFLAAKGLDTIPVIEMLRDQLWMGWPDKPMLDFFVTVWEVNQKLAPKDQLRIVLVDMQRPWKDIKERGDWAQYEVVPRDRQMADNILRDLRDHRKDKRNALFIVGCGHTMLGFKYFEGSPVTSAGWYLREELGSDHVYAILQHRCVQTNWGRVDGRLCLGLLESAFATLDNKPTAFPLDTGPFGEQPFDASPDRPVASTYRDGYSAYLYLGPLEDEVFSSLIPGFYTDEFVKELDRRNRLMFKKGLVEGCGLARLDGESFTGWMSNGAWGQPRTKWSKNSLGPIDAWHHGSDWKNTIRDIKHAQVMDHPEEVFQAARQLFENIRNADYDYFLIPKNRRRWNKFPTVGYYMTSSGYDGLVNWICKTFKANPIESVELGERLLIVRRRIGNRNPKLPVVSYKVTLRDASILQGVLPFEYEARGERGPHWHGVLGIDWHHKYKNGLPTRGTATP